MCVIQAETSKIPIDMDPARLNREDLEPHRPFDAHSDSFDACLSMM